MKKAVSFALVTAFFCCVSAFAVIGSDTLVAAVKEIPHYNVSITSAPTGGETVSLLSGPVYEVVSQYDYTKHVTKPYWNQDNYAPDALKITWKSKEEADYYTLVLSQNRDLTDPTRYVTYDTSMELEDLHSGTDYYYQVVASYANKTIRSRISHFKTAAYPRTIYLEGATNTRDLGGYVTQDGTHRIRQGMVYRGGNLDSLTAAGVKKAMYTYRFKTELDLRKASEIKENALDKKGINHISVGTEGAPQYVDPWNSITDSKNKEALRTAILAFAEADNYPIYVHCAIGRDRTGSVCFLISALCGATKEDLYLDYELSALSTVGASGNNLPDKLVDNFFTPMYNFVGNLEGDTYADKAATFLKTYLDITDDEISAIRANLLEEVSKS